VRINSKLCIGIDPGTHGAIVVCKNGEILRYHAFSEHVEKTGINKQIRLNPKWLSGVIDALWDQYGGQCDRITLEQPKAINYGGRQTIATICGLHQQLGQLDHAIALSGFQCQYADPRNWQGYHSLFASDDSSVKNAVVNELRQCHARLGIPLPKLNKADLSGVADAWAIAQYEYQIPSHAEIDESPKERARRVVALQAANEHSEDLF
jgi:hypothetical protein